MVNIDCEKCNIRKLDNFKLSDLIYNKKVKPGDDIQIQFTVECLNLIFAGDVKVCLYHGPTLIDSTVQTNVHRAYPFTGYFVVPMGDDNMTLRLSLLGQNLYSYDCEDYKDITIIASDETEDPTPEKSNMIFVYIALAVLGLVVLSKVVK